MSDFTFSFAQPGDARIGQWTDGVATGRESDYVDTPRASVVSERSRARRSHAESAVHTTTGDPPIGAQPGFISRQAMSAVAAPPHGLDATHGMNWFTARPSQSLSGAQRQAVNLTSESPNIPAPRTMRERAQRRAPTPYPDPLSHAAIRDANAALRREHISSEAGDTALDDPVPPYESRGPSRIGRVPAVHTPHTPGMDIDQDYDRISEITPGDSVSSAAFRDRSTPTRSARAASSASTSRTTISLTDSSVDRVCERLAAAGFGGVASQRSKLDAVPEEAATSAKNRKRHHLQHVKPGRETVMSGISLMLGAQEVRRDKRGNLVLVKHRK